MVTRTDRLLARIERKIGRFAIPNISYVVFGAMGFAFLLTLVRPEFVSMLALDWSRVMQGQVWRLLTFIFVPPGGGGLFGGSPIWTIFAIYMFYLVGTGLESHWGSFKLNAFYFIGMLGTILASAITHSAIGNAWLNQSLFLAYATAFPDVQFLLFFIVPVKVKWLGLIDAAILAFSFVTGGLGTKLAIGLAFANYVLFFAGHWIDWYKARNLRVRQAARRASMPMDPPAVSRGRTCAICGASEDDGADIRVCSCEKCGNKPRNLCLPHARNH
jgi:hypothetical protein